MKSQHEETKVFVLTNSYKEIVNMDFDQHLLGSEDNVYLPGTASGVSEDAISVFSQKRGNTVQHLPHSMHHSAMS